MYALVLLVHIAAYCGSSVQCSCLVWFLLPPIAYCGSSVQCSSVQFIHCVWNMCYCTYYTKAFMTISSC